MPGKPAPGVWNTALTALGLLHLIGTGEVAGTSLLSILSPIAARVMTLAEVQVWVMLLAEVQVWVMMLAEFRCG